MDINISTMDHTAIINVNGEIDDHTSKEIKEKADFMLYRKDIKNIIFDLKKVNFMDSSGIGLLMGRYKLINSKSGKCAVVINNNNIKKILALSGILSIFDCYENLDTAIKEYKE